MKRILFMIGILISTLMVYSNETVKISKNNDATSDSVTSATSSTDLEKALFALSIVHGGFTSAGYLGMLGEIGIGSALLYLSYNDPLYYSNPAYKTTIQNVHRILSSISYGLAGTGMIMSFVTFGIKVYNRLPVNLPHFILAMITTGFYLLDLASMFVVKYFFDMQSPYAQAVGIAHGVISSVLVASFTVTLISIPVFMKYKKVL
jgi:hypothetical protein